jgi:hypothetical protein
MSDPPPLEPVPERLNVDIEKTEHGRVQKPGTEAFSVALAKSDRRREPDTALPTDNAWASTVRPEYAQMTLEELARAAAANGNSTQSYAAQVEMNRRVAQAQIDAAMAQRDAANAQRKTSWAAWAFVPAALMGVVIGWLLAKLMGIA